MLGRQHYLVLPFCKTATELALLQSILIKKDDIICHSVNNRSGEPSTKMIQTNQVQYESVERVLVDTGL